MAINELSPKIYKNSFYYREECRICSSKKLVEFINLGQHPPSDAFLKESQLNMPENHFPLEVYLCEDCHLVQLGHVVSPNLLYKNYPYMTSISVSMQAHLNKLTESIIERFNIKEGSLVIDIGSNDGTLLKFFKKQGFRTLGVDPSNIAKVAEDDGIETINNFFNIDVAKKIKKEKGSATIITGTNVFAHIDNLFDFLKSVDTVLDSNGFLVLEFPYLVDLINKVEFDTIYHEHLSYFAIKPLTVLFKKFNMSIFDIQRLPVHGGSIRIFVKKLGSAYNISDKISELISLEENEKLSSIETYFTFANRVQEIKKDLTAILKDLKSQKKVIAGDGAPAKGNTLLNYCQIGTDILDYIVEMSPIKHGLYTPGTHIPIFPIDKIYTDKPDFLLILPWNIKEDIMQQQMEFKQNGGKFIVPIPSPIIY
ncbi:MAG: class I SAM-dependent methyltransferase [Candidatus Levybacteria bacterium]|nr:class I SAM-dependent methyltransferase [Candidatus Levybacteria bacterium]